MGPIPAKYFWPGFIVALLGFSVTMGVVTVMAAQSGNGPQIVENYDQTAQEWAAQRERRRASRQLGWQLEVRPGERSDGTAQVEIELRDDAGEPLDGLEGSVGLRRPSLAGLQGEGELKSVDGKPGVYRVTLPVDKRGVWDFEVKAKRGEQKFIKTVRKEL